MEDIDRLRIMQWAGDGREADCYLCGPCDPPIPLAYGMSALFYADDDGQEWTICVRCAARIDPGIVDRWTSAMERDIRENAKRSARASRNAECAHCARESITWDVRAMAAYKLRN